MPPYFNTMPNFDFMQDVPQQDNSVPHNAMSSMLGITLPSMPTMDDSGRYGITEGQQRTAGNRGMAQALYGAAQSFMGGGAAPSMQGGMNAGQVNNALLDQYSKQNLLDYDMKVKNAFNQIDLLNKKSQQELAQLSIEQERMKIDQFNKQKAISQRYAQDMAPVADKIMQKALAINPDGNGFAADVKGDIASMQAALEAGNIEKGDAIMHSLITRFPEYQQETIAMDVAAGVARATANSEVGLQGFEALKKAHPEIYGQLTLEPKPDGSFDVLSPFDVQKRNLSISLLQSQVAENQAQAEHNRNRLNVQKQLDPKNLVKYAGDIHKAIGVLQAPPSTDPKELTKRPAQLAQAEAVLATYGIKNTPEGIEGFLKASPIEQQTFIANNLYRVNAAAMGYGVGGSAPQGAVGAAPGGPATVPPEVGPGLIARLVSQAATGNLSEMEAAKRLDALKMLNFPGVREKINTLQGSNAEKLKQLAQMYGAPTN